MIMIIVIIIFITPVCACSCWPFVAVWILGGRWGGAVKVAGLVIAGRVWGRPVGDGGEKKNKKKEEMPLDSDRLVAENRLIFCPALNSFPYSSCSSASLLPPPL